MEPNQDSINPEDQADTKAERQNNKEETQEKPFKSAKIELPKVRKNFPQTDKANQPSQNKTKKRLAATAAIACTLLLATIAAKNSKAILQEAEKLKAATPSLTKATPAKPTAKKEAITRVEAPLEVEPPKNAPANTSKTVAATIEEVIPSAINPKKRYLLTQAGEPHHRFIVETSTRELVEMLDNHQLQNDTPTNITLGPTNPKTKQKYQNEREQIAQQKNIPLSDFFELEQLETQ